jgi:hypothetical protein
MPKIHGALVLAASTLLACAGVVDGAAPGLERGTAAISWSVAGSSDPPVCDRYGPPTLHSFVHAPGDVVRADRVLPCRAFTTDVGVPAGVNWISPPFEDQAGRRSSATARAGPFAVDVAERTDVPLAFTHEMMVIDKVVLTSSGDSSE